MKTTQYFASMRLRSDRANIDLLWIEFVIKHPEKSFIQTDGRIRLWAKIVDMENRYLRVILLEYGETVHNAFFDRRFTL